MLFASNRYRWEQVNDFPERFELTDTTTAQPIGVVVRDLVGQCHWSAGDARGACLDLDEAKRSAESAATAKKKG